MIAQTAATASQAATASVRSSERPAIAPPPNTLSGGGIWLMPVSPLVKAGKKMNSIVITVWMTMLDSVK